jgi:hypothetical protein
MTSILHVVQQFGSHDKVALTAESILLTNNLIKQNRQVLLWLDTWTNLLGFALDGMIIFGVINAPGSLHDSSLASFFGMYKKLQAVFDETGLKVNYGLGICASKYEFSTKLAQNFGAIHLNDMELMAIN